jgi:GTP-binding protein
MKFVDEVTIRVEAGQGGDGALSFRREKFVPRGGPDGGDGGRGGDVVFVGDKDLNTLADFRHVRVLRAENGEKGRGRNQTGRAGKDLLVPVPLGTRVLDAHTGELIGEITRAGERLVVARGGRGGFGNAHFKSSVNRAPRKTTPGGPGEVRELYLELQLLADVGLLGLPNAGKSTFLRAVSDARPKVADYPFTTLYPHLGVVRVEPLRSFVIADIPGLIEGAAEGAGLGIQFLRHLRRTSLLLHLVDMSAADPAHDVRVIEHELEKFSPALARRERWLVPNKMDLIPAAAREERVRALVAELGWRGPVWPIAAIRGEGCAALAGSLMRRLEALRKEEKVEDVVEHG